MPYILRPSVYQIPVRVAQEARLIAGWLHVPAWDGVDERYVHESYRGPELHYDVSVAQPIAVDGDDDEVQAQFGNAQGGWKEVTKFKDKNGNWVTRTLWGSGKAGF